MDQDPTTRHAVTAAESPHAGRGRRLAPELLETNHRPARRLSIHKRITLMVTAVAVLASVGISAYFYVWASDTALSHAEERVLHEVKGLAPRIEDAYAELRDDTLMLFATPPIQGLVRCITSGIPDPDGSTDQIWRARLTTIFEGFLQRRSHYTQMRYVGIADGGRELVRVDATTSEDGRRMMTRVAPEDLQQKGSEFYIADNLTMPPGSLYFSPAQVNRENGADQSGTLVVRSVAPVFGPDGKTFGFVIINADADAMLSRKLGLSDLPPGYAAFASTDSHECLRYVAGQGWGLVAASDPSSRSTLEWMKEGKAIGSNHPLTLDGEPYLACQARVRVASSRGARELNVAVLAPRAGFLEPVRAARSRCIWVGLGFVLLSLFAAAHLGRRIIAPLAEMAEAVRTHDDLGEGVDLPVDRQDEFGQLARALRDYSSHLVAARLQVEQAEARLQTIFDRTADGLITIDQSGNVQDYNLAAARLFGYPAEEVLGQNVRMLIPEAGVDQRDSCLPNYMATGGSPLGQSREVEGHRNNGTTFPAELAVGEIPIAGQRLFGGVIKDISTRKEQERQSQLAALELVRARDAAAAASAAKSEFLANMSHEIRTPMNAIIGLTRVVLLGELDDQQRDYLTTVASSAESLLQIINDILDFSKIEAGKLSIETANVQLHDLVPDVLRTVSIKAHQKGLELIYRIGPEIPAIVMGDPGRLRQVLLNLVGNAVKFTEVGEVRVEVELESAPRAEGDLLVRFTVQDTGEGISEDQLGRIFGAFEQADGSAARRHGGTGLGLTISKKLTEQMGGTLSAQSVVGHGTEFQFSVVLKRAQEESAPPRLRLEESALGSRALIVDDNAQSRFVLVEALERLGMKVQAAADATEAQRMLDSAIRKEQKFSVLLCDMGMPGTSGLELAEKTLATPDWEALPVVLLDSQSEPCDYAELRRVGIATRLFKPVKDTELHNAITGALDATAADPSSTSLGESNPAEIAVTPKGLRILLAEDSVPNQMLALALLKPGEHEVVVAPNGNAAVEQYASREFDIVLMDVQMPGMDGFDATKVIRTRESNLGGHIPIVAMTAHALKGDDQRCLDAGMDSYLSKPIDPERLDRAMAEAIAKAASLQPGLAQAEIPPSPAAEPVRALIDDLRELVGGNDAVLAEIVQEYLSEMRTLQARFETAIAAEDLEWLAKAAHRLKTAFRFFQLNAEADLAGEVEQASRSGALQAREATALGASIQRAITAIPAQLDLPR